MGTLIGVTGVVITVVVGVIALIRRIDTKVSRPEFHQTFERRDTRVADELKEVLRKIEQQNELSAEYRALTTDKLEGLSKDMEVLKDRAGPRRVPRR